MARKAKVDKAATRSVGIRLTTPEYERLTKLSTATGRSRSFLARAAVHTLCKGVNAAEIIDEFLGDAQA